MSPSGAATHAKYKPGQHQISFALSNGIGRGCCHCINRTAASVKIWTSPADTPFPERGCFADALLLARLGEREKPGPPTTIVTADANDAQRLLDEIAFFAPGLRCALFPDWKPCRTTPSRRTRT